MGAPPPRLVPLGVLLLILLLAEGSASLDSIVIAAGGIGGVVSAIMGYATLRADVKQLQSDRAKAESELQILRDAIQRNAETLDDFREWRAYERGKSRGGHADSSRPGEYSVTRTWENRKR